MSVFGNLLQERKKRNAESMDRSCRALASVVEPAGYSQDFENDALTEICRYFKIHGGQVPPGVRDLNARMDYVFNPAGILRRRVTFSGNWWKELSGVYLCEKKEGGTAALIPDMWDRYFYLDEKTGKRLRLNKDTAQLLEREAVCFYRPLPQRKLDYADIFRFIMQSVSVRDIATLVLAALAVTLLGLMTPAATSLLFNVILPSGQELFLVTIAVMLAGVAVSQFIFRIIQSGMLARVQQKMKLSLKNAFFARVLTLPTSFFKDYSTGEIAQKVILTEEFCISFCDICFGTGLTALLSLVYVFQIFSISAWFLRPVLLLLALQLLAGMVNVLLSRRNQLNRIKEEGVLSGLVFSLLSGVQKIKVAGREQLAYRKWAGAYARKGKYYLNPPLFMKIYPAITMGITIQGMILIYYFAYGHVTLAEYVTFNTCYVMVNTAVSSLLSMLSVLSMLSPSLKICEPVFQAVPEVHESREAVKALQGDITLNHLTFRYEKDGPNILDGLDLEIKKGQYVAIVGTTGCGKSTLLRLLLGFEKPDKGTIYYDNKNLGAIDVNSLRRHLGVVLQDGKLMTGDIFSNIAVSAPGLTMPQAWEAAEMAGIAEDIRRMPMGMHTMISEGSGGISGGQRQRLLIARAVAGKPSILMLDEATSALDNVTQKKVSDSLASMNCTRLVIAHRLSTIRQCDRILVLDKGKIIEDGTYEELQAAGGFFSTLVARQQLKEVNEEEE